VGAEPVQQLVRVEAGQVEILVDFEDHVMQMTTTTTRRRRRVVGDRIQIEMVSLQDSCPTGRLL